MEAIVILCTAPAEAEVAVNLARGLVEQRLAACVNVIPGLRSVYRYQGKIEDEPEVQLVIKTRSAHYAAVEAWLKAHHPYDDPEILALPVVQGSPSYLTWLAEQTERS
jgi:periplasmic divalent cation tolerance protein